MLTTVADGWMDGWMGGSKAASLCFVGGMRGLARLAPCSLALIPEL